MKLASCTAAALLALASPAFATSTILCRSTASPTSGPELALSVATTGVTQARFAADAARGFTTGFSTGGAGSPMIAQSWLDRVSLRLDIVDANADQRLVRLDTRRRGSDYLGILIHGGRAWRVRCSEEG